RRRGGEGLSQHEPDRGIAGGHHGPQRCGYGVRPCVRRERARQDIRLRARRHGAAEPAGHDRRHAAGRRDHRNDDTGARLMFAPLLGAIRADIDRQVGWAGGEVRRQGRYAGLIGALYGLAALAAVGALVVGLIALHAWLATRVGFLQALGIIGGGLLGLALILLLLALVLRRPGVGARPALQIARPAALLGAFGRGGPRQAIAGGEPVRLATEALRQGTRSELFGALALVAVMGLIAGRGLPRAAPDK